MIYNGLDRLINSRVLRFNLYFISNKKGRCLRNVSSLYGPSHQNVQIKNNSASVFLHSLSLFILIWLVSYLSLFTFKSGRNKNNFRTVAWYLQARTNKNFLYNHNVRNKEFTNFSKRKKKGIISFDSSIHEVRQNSESNDDPFCWNLPTRKRERLVRYTNQTNSFI